MWRGGYMNERETVEYPAEMTNEEHSANLPGYGELIIEMVHKIDKQDYLVNIYYFVKGMYDKCKK